MMEPINHPRAFEVRVTSRPTVDAGLGARLAPLARPPAPFVDKSRIVVNDDAGAAPGKVSYDASGNVKAAAPSPGASEAEGDWPRLNPRWSDEARPDYRKRRALGLGQRPPGEGRKITLIPEKGRGKGRGKARRGRSKGFGRGRG